MSLWIKSHQDISSHPKTRKAARKLSITTPQMVGHLHMLWHWCLSYAPVGDISNIDTIDIADAVMWDGDENVFINALIEVGFIDRDGENICIHDWQDYGGKLVEQREREAERKRMKRANPEPSTEENNDAEKDVHRTSGGRPRNVRVQIREEKSTEEQSTPDGVPRERAKNSTTPPPETSSSRNSKYLTLTPEREAMLNAVLVTLEKSVDWDMGHISDSDERKIAKILNKLEADGRTLHDVEAYKKNFVNWLNRGPDVDPPTPDQMLGNFDMILKFKREGKNAEPKLSARHQHDQNVIRELIAKKQSAARQTF